MATTTSLLKSAASTKKKVQQQADAEVAFEWQNSAQTYDDFVAYSNYIQDRQDKTSDPSQALSYAKTLVSARRSYSTNEIQRQQNAIFEGRGTTQDKMNSVRDLFYQAQDNGDYNLAQNLLSQYDGLSIKLQNEQEANIKALASAGSKAFTDLTNKLTKGVDDVTLPTGEKVTPLAVIAQDLETTGGSSATWEAAQQTLEALRGVIIDQYNTATSQEDVDKLEEKYGAGLKDIDKELKFSAGGKNLTAQEVTNAVANEQLNNPVYSLQAVRNEATGQNEFKLKENNIDKLDYIRQIDPTTGEEYYVPATIRTDQNKLQFGNSDQGRGVDTQITDSGEVIGQIPGTNQKGNINAGESQVNRDPSQTIGNRLKELGIIATQNGTTLQIKLPGESVDRQATIQPDGSIRYYDDSGQLVEIGITDRNLGSDAAPQVYRAGQGRIVSPDEVSDFGSKSAFGGQLSAASAQGNRYLNDITGNVAGPTSLVNGPIRVPSSLLFMQNPYSVDSSGYGTAVTSNLLQSASAQRATIQLQQEKQAMLQAQASALQSTNNFNLNQTPVAQLANNGILKRQLQVSTPTPAPRVVVAPPVPSQQITRTVTATPNPITSVGTATPYRSVTVR